MHLSQLTEQELQNLLMEETKKLTASLRQGLSIQQREESRKKIEEIIRLLEAKGSPHSGDRLKDHGQ